MQLLNQCPVCKSAELAPYAMKYAAGFPHVSRTICRNCKIVFANPVATMEELMAFYSNYYDKGNFGALDYKQRVSAKIASINAENVSVWQEKKKKILTYKQKGDFLDVGFGLGEELAVFHKLGFTVHGTEYDQDCIHFIHSFLPGADLFLGDLLQAGYPEHSFDVINICHVIEHLIDPVTYIKELQKILKPGGILIVGTPDIAAPAYKTFRILNFLSLQVPMIVDGLEHTVIFNKKNLSSLISSHGFEIREHYSESLGDSLSNILSSNLSTRKKIVRYLQTFVKVNQVIIAQKRI